jgi:hypothetical protein
MNGPGKLRERQPNGSDSAPSRRDANAQPGARIGVGIEFAGLSTIEQSAVNAPEGLEAVW